MLDLLDKAVSGRAFTTSRGKVFYPSSLGNKCDRALYNDYFAVEKYDIIEPRIQRIFDVGSNFEEIMEKYLNKASVKIDREVKLTQDWPPLSGRMDFLLHDPKRGKVVMELKTINERGFEKLIDAPKWDHFVQIQCYLHMSGIAHGVVVYSNKNDSDLKAFKQVPDDIFWEEATERMFNIMGMKSAPLACTGEFYCRCGGKKAA